MIRSNEECLKAFIDLGGLECILGCLQNKHEKVHIKVGFLVSALASEFPDVRNQFIELNGIEYLSKFVEPVTEYNTKCENILTAISTLSNCDIGRVKVQQLDSKFQSTLKTIVQNNKQSDECREIVEYSLGLLVKLKRNSCDETDR